VAQVFAFGILPRVGLGVYVQEGTGDRPYAVMNGDELVDAFSDRDEALARAASIMGRPDREPVFRGDDGQPNGQMRWLSASTPEQVSPTRAIDLETLTEAADSLNASPIPIPIDGGPGSVVHGTPATGGGVDANGWAHSGVMLMRADGTPHLMMRAELLPDIAQKVDSGRLAFGSIDINFDRAATDAAAGAIRGVRWESHALTNKPMNRGLMASTARAQTEESGRERLRAPGERLTMATTPTRAPGNKQTKTTTSSSSSAAPKGTSGGQVVDETVTGPPSSKAQANPPPVMDETVDSREDILNRAEVASNPDAAADAADDAGQDADLASRVAQLEAIVAALSAQNEALQQAAKAGPSREQLAQAAVAKAIRDGRVARSAEAQWLKVATLSGVEEFEKLTRGMRAIPQSQVAARGEAEPRVAGVNGGEPATSTSELEACMRAAGVSEAGIKRALSARKGEV